jgi:DNA integrity scanning protein DisA with diadenylate cyclase activity
MRRRVAEVARHRSAYRLAGALPGSLAIVVSQDGGVRIVRKKGGRVTFWEQE